MIITVGVADMKISTNKDANLITYALGTCIGLSIYDQQRQIGGLLHFMLPDSTRIRNNNHYMCADTAVPLFLSHFEEVGGRPGKSVLKASGAANISDKKDFFRIASGNVNALIDILKQNRLFLDNFDFGGNFYRTMKISLNNGDVTCRNHDRGQWRL